jgi:hypothetical protein
VKNHIGQDNTQKKLGNFLYMQPCTKLVLLEFSQTYLSTTFCKRAEKLQVLYESESAVKWLQGKRSITSILIDAGTKVLFSPQETINTVYLKAMHALQLVVLETEDKLKKVKESQSKKALEEYRATYSNPAHGDQDRASIVQLWQAEQKEINALAALFFKERLALTLMSCLPLIHTV